MLNFVIFSSLNGGFRIMTNHENQTNEQPERTAKSSARKVPFTPLGLARMKLPASGQQVTWDTHTRGLSVLVSSGGARTFRCTFCLGAKCITVKLGRVGEMDIAEARKRTSQYRLLAGDGVDPRKPRPHAAPSYKDVVDRFVEQL
jgi:Arm DNA-binding domain